MEPELAVDRWHSMGLSSTQSSRILTQDTLLHALFSSSFYWTTPSVLLSLLYHFPSFSPSYPWTLRSVVSPGEDGCPVSILLSGINLPPALCLQSPRPPDSRSSKWGYLEGITDRLEVKKNWTAGFGTASSTYGPSVAALGPLCWLDMCFVILLLWDSARSDRSERTYFLYRTASVQGTCWAVVTPKVVFVKRILYTRMEEIRTTSLWGKKSVSIFSRGN